MSDKISQTKPSRTPPSKEVKSIQLELFTSFVSNDQQSMSNTIEIWEKIPKYFFTSRQIEKLRPATGQPDPYKWTYKEAGIEHSVVIQPALIEQKDGSFKAFFPTANEELVEEALKRILTKQNQGIHDPINQETWVKFSLSMIVKELKHIGKGKDRPRIKHAIAVMSGCIITFFKGKKEVWKGSILQDLVTVDRGEYLEDTSSYHIARLPLFISHAINTLNVRQFNYERYMECGGQLPQWIYKRLINRYTYASIGNDHHFMYSDLKSSGLLQQAREIDNRRKVIFALDKLKEKKVINNYKVEEKEENRKIIDTKYTVTASYEFIKEQKAAGKRKAVSNEKAKNLGLVLPVDKQ